MNNFVTLNQVSKNYTTSKKINVLKKINYSFKRGNIYSLVGPSGSGKSTLLNILSLIDKPTKGSIKFFGQNINFFDSIKNDKIRAKKIGIIYQQNNLLPDFTALENVYLANLSITNNKNKAILLAKKILSKMNIIKRANHYPSELSGGEIQRVAISRALINEPEIILADELTGSLDQSTAEDVFKILSDLKSPTRIIIYATHNRYFANMADCKIELNSGKIKIITNARNK